MQLEKRGNPRKAATGRVPPAVAQRRTAVAIMDAGEYCTSLRGYSIYEMLHGRYNGATSRFAVSNS